MWLGVGGVDAHGRRLPPPSADGLAAARGRDAGAVRRPRLPPRRRRARDARSWRCSPPLPPRLVRRAPRLRSGRPADRLRGVRPREPSARRGARPPAGRTRGRARCRRARRAELAVPLPRRLRPHVQPVPLPLARLHPCAAARARERWAGTLGGVGRRVADDGGGAPLWDPAARRTGALRPARGARPDPCGGRRGRSGARAGHPVLAHRPRAREPVRGRGRRRRGEARRPRCRRTILLAVGRRCGRGLVARHARGGPRRGGRHRVPPPLRPRSSSSASWARLQRRSSSRSSAARPRPSRGT